MPFSTVAYGIYDYIWRQDGGATGKAILAAFRLLRFILHHFVFYNMIFLHTQSQRLGGKVVQQALELGFVNADRSCNL